MPQRPIMRGQTHATELHVRDDPAVAICGEMDVQIITQDSGRNMVYLPEVDAAGYTRITSEQLPNLIAALQRANDYLQGRG